MIALSSIDLLQKYFASLHFIGWCVLNAGDLDASAYVTETTTSSFIHTQMALCKKAKVEVPRLTGAVTTLLQAWRVRVSLKNGFH